MPTPVGFNILQSAVNTIFGEAYTKTTTHYQDFASTMPSSNAQEVYVWCGKIAKPRVWQGARVSNEPAPQTYTVVNLPWEDTVTIDMFALMNDRYDVFYRTVPSLAVECALLPDYWTRDLLEGSGAFTGTAQLGPDGLTYFNTAHPVDVYNSAAGTYINDFTGGGQTVNGRLIGGAFGVNALLTVREYMRGIKGEDGERLGVTPTMVMVPNELEAEADAILKTAFFSPPTWGTMTGQVGPIDNPARKYGLELLVNEHLIGSATKWYMFDTSRPSIKPLIWQEREAFRIVPRTDERDPQVIDEHRYSWNAWGMGAPGWAHAWLGARSGS
jgi:phage major head subunit gpT-like protein